MSNTRVHAAMEAGILGSGIIGFAGKLTECNILDFKAKARCYLMDVGLAYYFLTKTGCAGSSGRTLSMKISCIWTCGDVLRIPVRLHWRLRRSQRWGTARLIFLSRLRSEETYAVEVKSGKNSGRTAAKALEKKKADYILNSDIRDCKIPILVIQILITTQAGFEA